MLGSMAVSSGETGTHARFSVGATDGTNQYTHSIGALGGGATDSVANRRYMTDRVLAFITQTGAVDGEYSFSSFSNDAVTFTSTDPVTANALSKVVLFGGSDLQVKVGTFLSSATIGGAVDVTTVGFLADLVLLFANRGNYAIDTAGSAAFHGIGAAIQRAGVVTQASLAAVILNTQVAESAGLIVDDRFAGASLNSLAAGNNVTLSAFDAQGFTATTGQEAQAQTYGYMAFGFGGTKIPFLQVLDAPVAAGVATTTLSGLVPEFGLLLMSQADSVRIVKTDSQANGFAVGVFTATQSGTVGYVVEDGAATMQELSFVDGSAVRLSSTTGTISHEATVASMSADTLSLNYSVAGAPARKWILVGWGSPPAGASVVVRKRLFAW